MSGIGFATALGICVAMSVAPASAQAIDCFNVEGPVADIICSDADLQALDEAMGDAFRQVVRSTPRSERPGLLRSQRDWIAERNNCLGAANVPECIRSWTERRISNLSEGLAGTAGTVPGGADPEIESRPLDTLPGSAPAPAAQRPLQQPLPSPTPQAGTLPQRTLPGTAVTPLPASPAAPGTAPPVATTQAPPPVPDDPDAKRIAEYLSSSVWRAEIASGIRPGTIFLFFANGSLVTADCVAAYDIGSWRIEGSEVRLEDGRRKQSVAEIIEADRQFVRMTLTERGTGKEISLVLRPARGPFACSDTG